MNPEEVHFLYNFGTVFILIFNILLTLGNYFTFRRRYGYDKTVIYIKKIPENFKIRYLFKIFIVILVLSLYSPISEGYFQWYYIFFPLMFCYMIFMMAIGTLSGTQESYKTIDKKFKNISDEEVEIRNKLKNRDKALKDLL